MSRLVVENASNSTLVACWPIVELSIPYQTASSIIVDTTQLVSDVGTMQHWFTISRQLRKTC
jgi:hypothetical protein